MGMGRDVRATPVPSSALSSVTTRGPHRPLNLYRRLLLQARPYWLHMLGCLALNLLSIPLALLAPLPLKLAVDSVLGSQPIPGFLQALLPPPARASASALLVSTAVLLVLIALARHLQTLATSVLYTYTSEQLLQHFRAQLFRHVQRLSLSYHDSRGTTDSTYRIQYDAHSIQLITLNGVIPMITALVMLAGMIIVIVRMDWQLALVALGVSPVLFALSYMFGQPIRRRWKELKRLDSSAMSVVQEVLGAVRVVKAFGREEHEQNRFLRHSRQRVAGQVRVAFFQGGFDLLVGLVIAAGTAVVLFVGVSHVQSGALTLGELLVVMAYVAQLYAPLSTLSKLVTDLQSGFASAERAFSLLDELPDVVERPGARSLVRSSGAIAFRNLSFSYPDAGQILTDISFEISPGTRVGISGATGAGKTTLVSLLTRFYDPTAGAILLDGVDLRDYKLSDVRNQFALVLQDPVLFSASIAENIAYARPGATAEEIIEAAILAEAHEFIVHLPEGYQTPVGERGMRLSGGERQRIALARAFLKNAPILILDEPTSSVDVDTEAAILHALQRLMQGRTTLMIAHRLSTLDICDARIEIVNGRIVRAAGKITHPGLKTPDEPPIRAAGCVN
jgi:ATP-binding cassette subfamily B protein